MLSAESIIEKLGLKPHPEGGYYTETYRSSEVILQEALPQRYGGNRCFTTVIYYLLTPDTCSRLHRLQSDEVFHFYLGDTVTMLQLFPDGLSRTLRLGKNIDEGEVVHTVVPKGVWQGAFLETGGKFALLGTTVAPGFEFSDFEVADREDLIKRYPDQEDLIIRLT